MIDGFFPKPLGETGVGTIESFNRKKEEKKWEIP
jgi:hypothetical protein